MRRFFLMLVLVGSVANLSGCGGADAPKTDAEGKALKAPDVPPTGP